MACMILLASFVLVHSDHPLRLWVTADPSSSAGQDPVVQRSQEALIGILYVVGWEEK